MINNGEFKLLLDTGFLEVGDKLTANNEEFIITKTHKRRWYHILAHMLSFGYLCKPKNDGRFLYTVKLVEYEK